MPYQNNAPRPTQTRTVTSSVIVVERTERSLVHSAARIRRNSVPSDGSAACEPGVVPGATIVAVSSAMSDLQLHRGRTHRGRIHRRGTRTDLRRERATVVVHAVPGQLHEGLLQGDLLGRQLVQHGAGVRRCLPHLGRLHPRDVQPTIRHPRHRGAAVTWVPDGGLHVTGMEAAQVGQAAADTGAVLHELTPQQVSLEEAFMELTRDSVDSHGGPLPTQVGPGAAPMGAAPMGATSMKLEV